ncbi:hypothetical protein F2P56_003998 [Juglans regia]|uniref:Uncharacterized protein LOC109001743 n=2 Tax=Juglans regia TaxID=51240 RepID=A0A2I4FSR6_JUGRE|nr:uncharacterized protein LOC109001743 [Juglans regia]KAF5477349.1 hypothetical protein F2P56_003998 [Juglans regia]
MAELIDADSLTWKTNLVEGVFNSNEALLICSIPLNLRNNSDQMIWVSNAKGVFSVKSAYFLDCLIKQQSVGEASNGVAVLLKRQIVEDGLCPICQSNEENVIHVLWNCSAAMDVWGERESPLNKWSSVYKDFRLLWLDMVNRLDVVQLDQAAVILYKIWARRNCFVFKNIFHSPLALVKSALNEVEVFHESQVRLTYVADRLLPQINAVEWRPPADPFYKLNFDAAFDSEKRLMECYALLRSIKLCHELCLYQVVLEGDAKAVVDSVNGYNNNHSWQGLLIEDIQFFMKGQADWSLKFTKRHGNKAAHIVAKLGMYLDSESVWIEEGPQEVLSITLLEKPCTV